MDSGALHIDVGGSTRSVSYPVLPPTGMLINIQYLCFVCVCVCVCEGWGVGWVKQIEHSFNIHYTLPGWRERERERERDRLGEGVQVKHIEYYFVSFLSALFLSAVPFQ